MMLRSCWLCNTSFDATGTDQRYCTRQCARRAYKLRSKIKLIVRDHATCHLCGYGVDVARLGTCHEDAPTRDHIMAGTGAHRANSWGRGVRLAHCRCNNARGAMPLSEWFGSGRARLAGYRYDPQRDRFPAKREGV